MKYNKFNRHTSVATSSAVHEMFGVSVYSDNKELSVIEELKGQPDEDIIYTQYRYVIQKGVAIGGQCDKAVYHFPIEYMSGFYNLKDVDLSDFKIVLFKNWRSEFQKQWIRVVHPELENNIVVVDDRVYFEQCLLLGRGIGGFKRGPVVIESGKALRWMAQRIQSSLPNNISQNKMLLTKRNKTRVMNNWEDLKILCEKYCNKFNLELDIFDDDEDLGTIKQQLTRFHSSKIVIGSHGGGFINLLGCQSNSYFIECSLIDRSYHANGLPRGDPAMFRIHSALDYQTPAAFGAGCVLPASATPPEHSRVT